MSYPPKPSGYPPDEGYAPPGYPPPQMGYPPQAPGIYPPQTPSMYPPQSSDVYPPQQPPSYSSLQPAGYPPQQPAGYPPQQSAGYPPQQSYGYPSSQPSGYPPQPSGYPPQPSGYPPQAFPSQQPSMYPQGGGGYPPQGYGQPPVSTQPVAMEDGWMNSPPSMPPNCPSGLEYLSTLDQLLVKQKVEILEALIGFETKNKFTVKNSLGQKVFYAVEESNCLSRNCCGPIRPFGMKILDNYKNQVIHLERPLACDSCWFPCCLQTMEVYAPPGTLVGTVEQNWSILTPDFSIKDAIGNTRFKITGPFCTFTICGDVEFEITDLQGVNKGRITKQWSGLLREAFTDADFFGVTFPVELDVQMKAVMLGACFLIDAMFFEKAQNKEGDRPGMF